MKMNEFIARVKDIFGITDEDRSLDPSNFLLDEEDDPQVA